MLKLLSKHGVLIALIFGVVALTIGEFADQVTVIGGSAAMVAALPMLIKSGSAALGAYLVWCGWPRKRGRGLHCRRCGYHQEDQGRIVGSCPECGAPWRWIGRSRVGELRGQSWMVTVGLALLFLVTGTWMLGRVAPWLLVRWMPTDVLIQRLGMMPDDQLTDEWNEFDERVLTAEKLEGLAQALMRKKARDGYLSRRGDETLFLWIRTSKPVAAGKQFFSQVLSAAMSAQETAEVGEQVSIKTDAVFKGGAIVAKPEPRMVVCSAVYTNGKAEADESWVWPVRAITDEQQRSTTHVVTAGNEGPLEVRQVFWLVMGGDGNVTMGMQGPVLPTGATVVNQFEVTQTIAVKERKEKQPK